MRANKGRNKASQASFGNLRKSNLEKEIYKLLLTKIECPFVNSSAVGVGGIEGGWRKSHNKLYNL
jgi:hypothetical protein